MIKYSYLPTNSYIIIKIIYFYKKHEKNHNNMPVCFTEFKSLLRIRFKTTRFGIYGPIQLK